MRAASNLIIYLPPSYMYITISCSGRNKSIWECVWGSCMLCNS